ncbi:MAG TPA: L-threonylcarbamoyladenylate synthase [Chitinophagaceae bacterium]|nr:L-threonylcarbamoyladenylate synthase [Chitinophagaceae bacterium]
MDFEKDIEQCLLVLKTGGLILYPTDTVWGIGCDATNAEAVEKIYTLKKRSDEKAMIILVAGEKDVLNHVAAPDLGVFDHLEKTKKPTTVIYDGAIGLAENLIGRDGSIAIRICNEIFCKHLIKRFRKPIVSTSANISGQPVADNFVSIADDIKKNVDYIVRYRQDDVTMAKPSSIIKWKNGTINVIRP